MSDPEVTSRKFGVVAGLIVGAGLVIAGLVVRAQEFVLAPQRRGPATPLQGQEAVEYAWIPIILGVVTVVGSVVYWWTEVRPLLEED